MGRETGNTAGAAPGDLPHAWIVVNTQPHRETVALDNLRRQQFVGYCPMVRRQVRHARKTRQVLRPLFPGYLFVAVAPQVQRWRPMLSTLGVRSVVRFGEELSYLDAGFIDSLRAREIDGVIGSAPPSFAIGQQVRFNGGAFEGLVATIIAMDERDRLTVLLNLLQSRIPVKVDADALTAA